jgi:hypothetical protein
MCMAGIWNIDPLARVYNTRFHKRMENKERAHLKTHYQKELEDTKNNMTQMASLLEQLFLAQSRIRTSS